MKKSRYNHIVVDEEQYILYNFLTTSFIVLNAENFKRFEQDDFDLIEGINNLKKAGMVLADDYDEDAVYEKIINSEIEQKQNLFNEITIFTTTACNAQCYYCYEKNLKPITLTQEVMDAVVKFIAENYNGKEICLRWFGGEPLVNYQAIDYICDCLQQQNIKYHSRMISNAYLFNEELINLAKNKWLLTHVQITLDGIFEEYDKIKNYKEHPTNAFLRVINNIKALTNAEINVSVRINYSVDDIARAQKIIDYLADELGNNPHLHVYCAALRENNKPAVSSFNSTNSPQLILLNYLFDKGFLKNINSLLPHVKAYPCEAWIPRRYFVYPNGNIFKCQHATSDNSYVPVGNMLTGEWNQSVVDQWTYKDLPEKCKNCSVSLICRGGCTSVRLQNIYPDGDCCDHKNSIDGLLKLYYKLYKEVEKHGSSKID